MDWTQIIVTLIVCLFGSAGLITGYLKYKLGKAEKQNNKVKEIDAKIYVQKASCSRYELIHQEMACRKINGEQINGELKASFKDYREQCEELQRLYDERAAVLRQN